MCYIATALSENLSSYILRSEDGVSWHIIDLTYIFSNNPNSGIKNISYNKHTNKYISVGLNSSNTIIISSSDGLNWVTDLENNLNSNSVVNCIENGFINSTTPVVMITGKDTVNDSGFIASNIDGVSWTNSNDASDVFKKSVNFIKYYSAEYNLSYFIAVGSDEKGGVVACNGHLTNNTWLKQDCNDFPNGEANCFDSGYDGTLNSIWVAGGYLRNPKNELYGLTAYSSEGVWHYSNSIAPYFKNGKKGVSCVKYFSDFGWIAGGSNDKNGIIVRSVDANNWDSEIVVFSGTGSEVCNIAYNGRMLVAVGTKLDRRNNVVAGIASSIDNGLTWNIFDFLDIGFNSIISSIIYSNVGKS